MIVEDKFLTQIIGKNCFKLDSLNKKTRLLKNSFYTYEFEYDPAKISTCNQMSFDYISSRVELYLHKKNKLLKKKPIKNSSIVILNKKFEKKYLKDINKVSLVISKTSRFYKDINLKKYASEMYKNWGYNSFVNGYAQDYFLAKHKDGHIAGMVTLKINNESKDCVIDLIGVLNKYQNQNVGSILIENVLDKYSKYNIYVGTQSENIRALSFYQKNNFKIFKNILIYHKHT